MDEQQIAEIIDNYTEAVNNADADQLEALFWHADTRFSEVEKHIAEPFGQAVFLDIGNWIRRNAKSGLKQRFYNTAIHLLSDCVAYSVSLREDHESSDISRVTFIYLKQEVEWKIIHGHFSRVPS
jgi:ketosteroid isomerase-like protein